MMYVCVYIYIYTYTLLNGNIKVTQIDNQQNNKYKTIQICIYIRNLFLQIPDFHVFFTILLRFAGI